MADPFVPERKQEEVVVKITKKEAVLLDKLRRYTFGEFIVYKANGVLVRVEIKDSQMIEADAPIDL